MRHLVDDRAVARLGDGPAGRAGGLDPGLLRLAHLAQRLLGRVAGRRAILEVRDVGHPAGVLLAPEQVDVVVLHGAGVSGGENTQTLPGQARRFVGGQGRGVVVGMIIEFQIIGLGLGLLRL